MTEKKNKDEEHLYIIYLAYVWNVQSNSRDAWVQWKDVNSPQKQLCDVLSDIRVIIIREYKCTPGKSRDGNTMECFSKVHNTSLEIFQGLCCKPSLFSVKLPYLQLHPVSTWILLNTHGTRHDVSVPLKRVRKTFIFDKAYSYGRISWHWVLPLLSAKGPSC